MLEELIMNKKILRFFILSISLLVTGCSNYVEPKGTNLGSIIIVEYPKLAGGSGIDTELKIDNKSIYPERVASILPGKHEFSMVITAYYKGRAKHASIEKFSLDILPRNRYIVKITTDRKTLSKVDENVNAKYTILNNNKIIMQKNLLLKDSALFSKASNGVDPMVLDSIVYSAVLSAGI